MDAISTEKFGFNPAPATVMHVDLNSCFATIEQQANPLLRGKPVAVGAYTSPGGCILAASYEAKRLGVKTGMRVGEGRVLCPNLIVLPSDPPKYRFINRKFLALLGQYTADIEVKSIDEMVLSFLGSPSLNHLSDPIRISEAMRSTAQEIKLRIKSEIGEWLTVSIGIAPNRYLAKIGSGLHKPDGLDEICRDNIEKILSTLELEDLCGIKKGNGGRLRTSGIRTTLDFYHADIKTLRRAFRSVVGYHWWLRLHGWEADDREFGTKSVGHSYALYKPYFPTDPPLHQILCQLVEKMGQRLRGMGYGARGIHVSVLYRDWSGWNHGETLGSTLYASRDFYKEALRILLTAPERPVRILAVSCFSLTDINLGQLGLFEDDTKKRALTQALDGIHKRWGDFVVTPARMLSMEKRVTDRIAFGNVRGLETL